MFYDESTNSQGGKMDTITISDAREFSLKSIQRNNLVKSNDLQIELICFEAGQLDKELSYDKTSVYQVLEGELLIKQADESKRLGKGKLLTVPASAKHTLENAGGGLLVVMATRSLQ
jgi:mannose-6-phosphate isomerase-like protein (cupin superfamily)